MTSLLGRLLPLFAGTRRVEDLFTEAVARLFERRPDICLGWLESLDLISASGEDWPRHVHVSTQRTFVRLDEHETGSRPDLIVEICCASEDDESEPYTEIVMFESKIGSVEGEDQLKRYAAHLNGVYGTRKTLVYITRNYDPKDEKTILASIAENVRFVQLRWHNFYRFLQTVEKDALIEEVMLFMEEQVMARSYRFSTVDLMALSGVPRAFEIFDETFEGEVKAELENFANNKRKPESDALFNVRVFSRYVRVAPLHGEDLFCFVGYHLDDAEYPWIPVDLVAKPRAFGREASVAVMKKLVLHDNWEGYNLDDPREWAGVSRGISLATLLGEEDHVAAVKRFFCESIRQLREELTVFKNEHPELPWNSGS